MALLSDPPTPTMSQGSSRVSLTTPSTPSRAPQNIDDHLDLFPTDTTVRSPQQSEGYIAPPSLFTHQAAPTPPPPPPKGPQERGTDVSSMSNPHTQPIQDLNAFVAPHQDIYAQSTAAVSTVVPAGYTIIEPVASYTYNAYPNDSAYQTTYQQQPIPNYYQQPYQEAPYTQAVYQKPYPQAHQETQYPPQDYPEPELVDTVEKVDLKPTSQTGKRKRLYWIGGIVIVILVGAIIGLVVAMNKDSGSGNKSNNSTSGNGTGPTTSLRSSTSSGFTRPTGPTTSNGAIGPTGVPVVVPTTAPPPPPQATTTTTTTTTSTSSSEAPQPPKPSTGSGGGGNRVTAPPLPPLPPKDQCQFPFCSNYFWACRKTCKEDGDFQSCVGRCNGEVPCEMDCERDNACLKQCNENDTICTNHCRM
ncbi:hypothetical protein BGX33_001150 [Mortierella sp. NVP41]|nr:hypothetical protein BGX33_001150 [Mortierella sp. NVP41]